MADIALLVVEEFERTAKGKQQRGRGGQELPAGAGDPAASATASKASEWGSWAAAVLKEAAAAAAGPTAALGVAAVDGFFSA